MINRILLGLTLILSGFSYSYYGDPVEVTEEFHAGFIPNALTARASVGWTVYKRNCLLTDPISGKCIKEEEFQAKGDIGLDSLLHKEGQVFYELTTDPITKQVGKKWFSNIYYRFKYKSSTKAEKKLGGVVIDHPWKKIHPEGMIHIWLCANHKTGYTLNYKFEAEPGSNDAPNNFIRDYVAHKIKPRLADHIKQALKYPTLNVVMGSNTSCS